MCYYVLFNLEDWENIIHFGNLFASIGKKTYFLALGTIPVTGVGFIGRKITAFQNDLSVLHGRSPRKVTIIKKKSYFFLQY